MDFRPSEDQATLAEGVRDFLAGTHGPEVLRALDADATGRSPGIAASLREMGLPGLAVPEDQGGLGLSLLDAVLIAMECGRAALAEPLADTAFVAAPLLARAGGHKSLLQAIASGEASLALQHPANPWVADLAQATHILSAQGDSVVLASVGSDAAPCESVDPLRRLSRPVAVEGEPTGIAPGDLLDVAALMSAAQALGVADAMLKISTEYACTRQQFGQPIGAFQAIKHHLASSAVAIEFARPVVYRAAQALDEASVNASVHISHAKIAACDAATAMAETAIQVHGAMGYTYEVDLHFWMKRSWALAGAWGDRAFHAERVQQAVIGGTMPIGPAETFS